MPAGFSGGTDVTFSVDPTCKPKDNVTVRRCQFVSPASLGQLFSTWKQPSRKDVRSKCGGDWDWLPEVGS
jgi:hypothetical protein